MNYLAHLYLSPEDDQIRIGCFIADTVKGSQLNSYSDKIQQGIFLHREIDVFTDTHPIVKECIIKLRPNFRLYSGVITDIYFDHFLSKNWDLYTIEPLSDFVRYQYNLIQNNQDILPAKILRVFSFMKQQNWLENYKDLNFLENVFKGMSQRTPYFSNMENAVKELIAEYSFYESKFFEFFPIVCKKFKGEQM